MTYVVDTYAVENIERTERTHATTVLLGLLLTVVAPLTAAVWALAKFWPISAGVWIAGAMVFWAVVASAAADEHDLALE